MDTIELIEKYNSYLRNEKALAPGSIEGYMGDLAKLQSHFESKRKSLVDLTAEDISEFVSSLRGMGLTPKSQARVISGIRAFYKYLRRIKYISTDPCEFTVSPKVGLRIPVYLTISEVAKLIDQADTSTIIGRRNRAIMVLLYGSGLRLSEMISLTIDKVDLESKTIQVVGKGDKERIIPIGDVVVDEIRNYLVDRETLNKKNNPNDLFLNKDGGKLSSLMVYYFIKDYATRAEIKKNVGPHIFRHTYATHLLENGADLIYIQKLMGHTNIASTTIYTHITMSKLREQVNLFHPSNKK